MKKLFIHNPLFRLLSPLFSGGIVYLFILLINNNVEQLQEQFLSQELYVCIGLSFIIQELSRLLVVLFSKLILNVTTFYALIIQVTASILLSILVTSISIHLYFNQIIGYTPNSDELWLFNSIFCSVTLIYILLHISHQYLHKVNTEKLNDELIKKQLIEEDFITFKNTIKPELLFSSLETIIAMLKDDKSKIDDLIDHMSSTYRYILNNNKRQLTNLDEEVHVLHELLKLFNCLPFRKTILKTKIASMSLVVPGSLLNLIEYIIKHSISTLKEPLFILLSESEDYIEIVYQYKDKIVDPFNGNNFEELKRVYAIYSNKSIIIEESNGSRRIALPKLYLKE